MRTIFGGSTVFPRARAIGIVRNMRRLAPLVPSGAVVVLVLVSGLSLGLGCGGAEPPAKQPTIAAEASPPGRHASASKADSALPRVHDCGVAEKVHQHDLHAAGQTEAFVPCAQSGKHDYSGLITVETIPEGVHITIHATDDEVNTGALGDDVKTRDAVLVYPKGKGSKAVEVPLIRTTHGYSGDKIVAWDDLDVLTDEGTKIHIAVFDHDKTTGESAEELSVHVGVSTGKSCERALSENPQTIEMGKKGQRPDLNNEQLGAPMKSSAFFAACGLADSANADICVAVKGGKPLGVSVKVSPQNNKVAACIDRSARHLSFPQSDKLDVVHQKF